MASQRITRDTFDAVVQEKMKRYRISMDQAISDTVREFQLDGSTTRMPMDNYDSLYREKQMYSFQESSDCLNRNWDTEPRRDNISSQSYSHDLGRESSGGRISDQLLDRWSTSDSLPNERLYREELKASNRRSNERAQRRSLDCNELMTRDLNHRQRNWEIERNTFRTQDLNMDRQETFRECHSPEMGELGSRRDTFRSQVQEPETQMRGVNCSHVGKGPGGRGKGFRQGKDGEAAAKHQVYKTKTGDLVNKSPSFKFSVQIQKWAKFNVLESVNELLKQHKALFKVKTETCKMIVDCFKGPMTPLHREQCFSAVKAISHPAMKSPKIDNALLDLLVETKTVCVKNDFFEVIKPFDKEMMMIQQRLLRSVIPLLMASNTFDLKHTILTDPRQLLGALKSTVFLCRKSIVLLGQTFAMITAARQSNVLDALGISITELKPSEYPNFTDSFLFGEEFISQLRGWLQKSGNKLTLKSKGSPTLKTCKDKEETKTKENKTDGGCQERKAVNAKAVDSKAVDTIDQLLENAKKGGQTEGEKPAFWFLFDKDSSEYKYYRQKLGEFQNSIGQVCIKNTQTKVTKKSPEELACESVRAMLYARKAQTLKRRLFRSVTYSRKRKLIKVKRPLSKKVSVKVESVTEDLKQEPPIESTTEKSTCKVEVVSEKPEDKCPSPPLPEPEKEEKPKPLSIDKESSAAKKPLDVDEKTKDTAIKLAQFVVQMGPEIEEFSMENSVNNPEFWFLREKDSPAYAFYKCKLQELMKAEEDIATDDEDIRLDDGELENIRTGDDPQNESDVDMEAECEAAQAPGAPIAAYSQMPTPARPPIARKRVAKLKVGMLPPKRVCLVEDPKVHDPVRIEYERPRGRGYNKRKKPVDLEFANKKLSQQNVGFQMLRKMGWSEGRGLGTSGSGIKNPIKVGAVSSGEGLGVKGKEALESTKDNFDAFRQRMMKMYKQKITK